MINNVLTLIGGIILLVLSGEVTIRSAQRIASKLGISETFIGLTILSIGTSLAELGTHLVSSFKILHGDNVSGIAVGTNIGSNIVQITAILGIVALFMKIYASKKFLKRDYIVMLGSIVILFLFSLNGILSRVEGLALAGLYIIYLWILGREEQVGDKLDNYQSKHLLAYTLALPVGIVGLLLSAAIVVNSAEVISAMYGLKETLIGTLIIGVGTALPELTTSIIAIYRKSVGMAAGVLIGSNITNPLFMMGIGAAISTYTIAHDIIWFDLPFWFAVSLVVLVYLWFEPKGMKKWQALTLIGFYVVYVYVRVKYLGIYF